MTFVQPPPLRTAWLVWGLGALFYMMGFFQRVVPAVITTELMQEFQISATGLGSLTAFYFYSYMAMQIPTGIMADIWGTRRLLTAGSLLAGMGTLLFALAPNYFWANLGRFLIGGSVAVAFVGLLALTNNWFPPRYYAFMSGVALLFGIIGAVFAGPPLRLLMNIFGWRNVITVSALVIFILSICIWFFIRDYPHQKGYADLTDHATIKGENSLQKILAGIRQVFRYRNTFLLSIIPGGIVGSVLAFSGLWGVPFLTTHYDLNTTEASTLTSILLLAWAVGGPFFGWFSDRLGYRKPLYIVGCLLLLLGWIGIIYLTDISYFGLVTVILLTGFSSGCMMIGFAYAKESVPRHLSGTVSGVINMGVMTGPSLLQPGIGWILDNTWQGKIVGQVRIYGLDGYQSGFLLMIAWAALALIMLFFTRETHCRQMIGD